jgi:hypothetical protein
LTIPFSVFTGSVEGIYDLFLKYVSSTPVWLAVPWVSGTARGTAISWDQGVPVKESEPRFRHIGTVYYDGSKVYDTEVARGVANPYNPENRSFGYYVPGNVQWTHDPNVWQLANNSSDSIISLIIAPSRPGTTVHVHAEAQSLIYTNDTSPYNNATVGIGVDSMSSNSARINHGYGLLGLAGYSGYHVVQASLDTQLAFGARSINWVERYHVANSGDQGAEFYSNFGINEAQFYKAGIQGFICM